MDNTICKKISTAITRCRDHNQRKGGFYVVVRVDTIKAKDQPFVFRLHNVTFQGEPTEPVAFDGFQLNHKVAKGQ